MKCAELLSSKIDFRLGEEPVIQVGQSAAHFVCDPLAVEKFDALTKRFMHRLIGPCSVLPCIHKQTIIPVGTQPCVDINCHDPFCVPEVFLNVMLEQP